MIRSLALLAALSSGCFFDFEDLADQAQSDSVGPEDGLNGDFATDVASVPLAPNNDGLRFVVAGENPFSISTYVYDADGSLTFTGIEPPGLPTDTDVVLRVASPANSPGIDGLFAVGFPQAQLIAVFEAGRGLEPPRLLGTVDPMRDCQGNSFPGFGRDFVFAPTDVGGGSSLVVLSDNNLILFNTFANGMTNCIDACTLDGPAPAMIAADVDPASAGDELLVPVREGNMTNLQLFRGTDIPSAAGSPCTEFSDIKLAMGLPPDFGALILAGQIDGDTDVDLLAYTPGANELRILLNPGPGAAGQPPILFSSEEIEGAESIAIGDVSPEMDSEILVGVPIDEAGNDDGRVHVFGLAPPGGAPLEKLAELRDSNPEDNQLYGRSVTAGRFRLGGEVIELPVIGANGEVFTVFQTTSDSEDPRI